MDYTHRISLTIGGRTFRTRVVEQADGTFIDCEGNEYRMNGATFEKKVSGIWRPTISGVAGKIEKL